MEKIRILAESPDPKDETAHLRPIIEFLKEQGLRPYKKDCFEFGKDGYGEYYFNGKIDWKLLNEYFEFPESIVFSPEGTITDRDNLIQIMGE